MKILHWYWPAGGEAGWEVSIKGWYSGTTKALIDHVIEKSARKSAISPSVPTAISNLTLNAARTFFSDARQWQAALRPFSRLVYRRQRFANCYCRLALSSPAICPRLPEILVSQFETIAKRTPRSVHFTPKPRPDRITAWCLSVRKSYKVPCHTFIQECAAYAAGCSSNAHGSFPFPHEQDFISYNTENDLAPAFVVG